MHKEKRRIAGSEKVCPKCGYDVSNPDFNVCPICSQPLMSEVLVFDDSEILKGEEISQALVMLDTAIREVFPLEDFDPITLDTPWEYYNWDSLAVVDLICIIEDKWEITFTDEIYDTADQADKVKDFLGEIILYRQSYFQQQVTAKT